MIADILLGIVGGIVGGWFVGLVGFGADGMIWSILVAILGAVILIWITRLTPAISLVLRRKRPRRLRLRPIPRTDMRSSGRSAIYAVLR